MEMAPLAPRQKGATRALVADDDPVMRSLVASCLKGIVDDVAEVDDGLEAWQRLSKESFHLAIVDLMMPGINGFALIQCLRGHPRTRHIPIVVITSSPERGAFEKALELGASAILTKPVTWSTFKSHVTHLMRLAATAEAADRMLARQATVASAQAELFGALAALAHGALRRQAVDPAVNREFEARVARIRAGYEAVATLATADVSSAPLAALLAAARKRMAIDVLTVATDFDARLKLECSTEAMICALASCLSAIADNAAAGATIEASLVREHDAASIAFKVGVGSARGLTPETLGTSLAIAATLPGAAAQFDLALACTLLAAHGASMDLPEPTSPGSPLLVRLPADRLQHPTAAADAVAAADADIPPPATRRGEAA